MYNPKTDALRIALVWMALAGLMSATAVWAWMKIPLRAESAVTK